ncbi:MAG: BMP family ABC transporter substrate-binding protein [Turicibacter sp.]|jgi:basic membrane protein A|nr:BMP family ABC transporter substrate-binding protein [Turicibacter sp.]
MKKKFSMLTLALAATLGLVACGKGAADQSSKGESTDAKFKVGMMTDLGNIDDKSFNQGTWEGIERYKKDYGTIETKYLKPTGEATQDFLDAADNLISSGHEMIIAPGFKFEEAIAKLQVENPDQKFVIIDGQPRVKVDGKVDETVTDNTLAIYFAEQEAGFLAGIAAALETETNKVGFIGGMVSPAVQKFGYGFVMGVAYANANLGTNVEVADYLYNGTFTDVAGGKAQAGGMYDKGIDIIFTAAGAVGSGVIAEGKERAEAGENVYVIGVDVDQYEDGLLSDGRSVILTSAIKRIDNASYDAINQVMNGNFDGGKVVTLDAKNDAIGLPKENPNLSEVSQSETDKIYGMMKDGSLVIPSDLDGVEAKLTEYGYNFEALNLSGE